MGVVTGVVDFGVEVVGVFVVVGGGGATEEVVGGSSVEETNVTEKILNLCSLTLYYVTIDYYVYIWVCVIKVNTF